MGGGDIGDDRVGEKRFDLVDAVAIKLDPAAKYDQIRVLTR